MVNAGLGLSPASKRVCSVVILVCLGMYVFYAVQDAASVAFPQQRGFLGLDDPALTAEEEERLRPKSISVNFHDGTGRIDPLASPTFGDCGTLEALEPVQEANGIPHHRIAIVMAVLRGIDYKDYTPAVDSVRCYAAHYGYQLRFINMTDDAMVGGLCNHTDVFFKRHCALAHWMEQVTGIIDYVLYLDADMGVINPCHLVQEYIEVEKPVELYFYDRYYDHEVAAGSYLVKNSPYARNFLRFWADYFYRLPHSLHGTDNGALHQVFMEKHFTTPETQFQCYRLWNSSNSYEDLFTFQACTQQALGLDQAYFCDGRVKLVRKLAWGWVRDGWLTGTRWAPADFMFHGWKLSKLNGEWRWPFQTPANDTSFGHFHSCVGGALSSVFAHLPEFERNNTEVIRELGVKVQEVRGKYNALLTKAKLLCPEGTRPVAYGRCGGGTPSLSPTKVS